MSDILIFPGRVSITTCADVTVPISDWEYIIGI